jgi:phospholipid transport system substrate-binding protein
MRIWSWSSSHRWRPAAGGGGVLAALAVFWIALAPAMAVAAEGAAEPADFAGARKVVEETLQAVLSVLDQPGLSSWQRRKQIEQIAYQRFDFVTMSKLVVARPWRKFSKSQKQEFVSEFKQHLSRSYGKRIGSYRRIDIEIAGHVVEPRGDVTVKTLVVGGEYDGAEINYRMRHRDNIWKAIDVVIEGVSLVANFRSQFQPILSQGGPEELLSRLKEKNAELVAEDAAEEAAEGG